MNQGALKNIRVIDLSRILAGPYCTMLLGDMGADVIKIEQPQVGDASRQWGPPWVGGESAYFLSINRNKRSMTLDLKHQKGQAILKGLISKADILVENFMPGTTQRMGLDYATLSAEFPALIYCSISGYGQTGPYKDRPGFDFMIQAQGGVMSITGPEEGPPYKVGVAILDVTSGLYAAIAILGALHYRNQSGKGQYIDVALLDSQAAWLINVAQNYFATGTPPRRYGNAHPNIVPYETFPTQDSYLALAIGTDAQYRRFCETVDRLDLWDDERFRTNASRVAHRQSLISKMQELFRQKCTDEWLDLLTANKIPAGPINDIPTLFSDPQILARNMIQEIEHPTLGRLKQVGPVAKFSETPATLRQAPPLLGEHTDNILRDELGYTDDDISNLRTEGVI